VPLCRSAPAWPSASLFSSQPPASSLASLRGCGRCRGHARTHPGCQAERIGSSIANGDMILVGVGRFHTIDRAALFFFLLHLFCLFCHRLKLRVQLNGHLAFSLAISLAWLDTRTPMATGLGVRGEPSLELPFLYLHITIPILAAWLRLVKLCFPCSPRPPNWFTIGWSGVYRLLVLTFTSASVVRLQSISEAPITSMLAPPRHHGEPQDGPQDEHSIRYENSTVRRRIGFYYVASVRVSVSFIIG
jgi:hypothetical protein